MRAERPFGDSIIWNDALDASAPEKRRRASEVVSRADSLSFRGALIVEAALSSGADVLLSEDLQHGRCFDGTLTAINPFKSADTA